MLELNIWIAAVRIGLKSPVLAKRNLNHRQFITIRSRAEFKLVNIGEWVLSPYLISWVAQIFTTPLVVLFSVIKYHDKIY